MTATSWNICTGRTTDGSVGTIVWQFGGIFGDITACDGNGAWARFDSSTTPSGTRYTNGLIGLNFGVFAGLTGTLVGIEARVRQSVNNVSGGNVYDHVVQLQWNGVPVGENKAKTGTAWPSSFAYSYYGGYGDKWGSGITLSDLIANPNALSLRLECRIYDPNSTADPSALPDCFHVRLHTDGGALLSTV